MWYATMYYHVKSKSTTGFFMFRFYSSVILSFPIFFIKNLFVYGIVLDSYIGYNIMLSYFIV